MQTFSYLATLKAFALFPNRRPLQGLIPVLLAILAFPLMAGLHRPVQCQLFPENGLLPRLLAGPRDPVTSANLVGVRGNPNEFGDGIEAEVSLGTTLPVFGFGEKGRSAELVVGIEGGVFARFGLQVLERELVATDWVFAVPVVWRRDDGWVRFRYFHSNSHLRDEYSRRFDERGRNFSRDAADLEWDEDAGPNPLLHLKVGAWLPPVANRRSVQVALGFLYGPFPLGQFNGDSATQLLVGLYGYF